MAALHVYATPISGPGRYTTLPDATVIGAAAALIAVLLVGILGRHWALATGVGAVIFPTLVALPQWWDHVSQPLQGHSQGSSPGHVPVLSMSPQINAGPDFVSSAKQPSSSTEPVLWDADLSRLVNALARAIPEPADIRRIKVQSGISTMYVVPDGTPLNRWQFVVERAADEGAVSLDRICELALAQSPRHELHEAVAAWRSARDRSS